MGSAVSVEAFPDRLDQDQCQAFVGGEAVFDLPKFNQMCDADGTVSKAEVLAMAEDDLEDMAAVAETVERNGIFFSFAAFDADGSGGLTHDEFVQAAKALGYHLLPDNVKQMCKEIDMDDDGLIDEEEFVKFVRSKVAATEKVPDGVDATTPGVIYEHLGTLGAQHGYGTALAILKRRPEAARDKFSSNGRYRGSDWYPLHYVLTQDVSDGAGDSNAAAARARRLVATPIVQALVKAYPAAAAHRCMEGVRFPKGHLPLELAVAKGWALDVVEPLLRAYPDAATILDPATDKAQKSLDSKQPITSLKSFRWLRQIAVDAAADEAILSLFPKPKLVDGKVTWISGKDIADAEAQRARYKAERDAKRKAKVEAKKRRESERQKQLENDAKLQELLDRHSRTSRDLDDDSNNNPALVL
ncbi:hypothetical protein CTAYLR_003162 [Chrysophaeum taylorii]|uniref:EF-hand domain-containing protein n=1 Tax=Chrysophaeum taylorii TaxID=2483200 RepID=A0AAD7UQ00_9STRA|nr:hypothetical protein CTAYLR_003162 [Chrysophaeum taylorii]